MFAKGKRYGICDALNRVQPLRLPFGRHLPQGELTEGQERVAWAIAQGRLIHGVSRIYLLIQGF